MKRIFPDSARRFFHGLFAAALLALFAAAPARAEDAPEKSEKLERLRVVATFSILADMTRAVGGDRVEVHTLIGPDSDAHAWRPSPRDSRALARAKLVVANGLGFEGWIDRLIASTGFRGALLVASRGVKTRPFKNGGSDPRDRQSQRQLGKTRPFKNGGSDPHAWLDLSNAVVYVDNIASALAVEDPRGKDTYFENASRYKSEISRLDAEIRRRFDAIPPTRRKAVASHDAFAYFAGAYGVEFISPLDAAGNEPSARDVGRIIYRVRNEKIPAVFLENISDPRMLERIRAESGAKMGGALYSDALSGKDGPAATYLDLMRHNAETIARALSD
ncbi:MAG: zinc ABC transporter substrate-binding protein [Candidatus Accumulibacter sp.]|jgi:zinc/manganese transport system substrate-binding protein|nr:zinc ABC transporter substrate-binding protein [Accumulibacter sp.]